MELNNLSSALARAQATMGSAGKSGHNPRFKTSFSTLEDLILASRESLVSQGLSVSQFLDQSGEDTFLVTQLRHSSGETIYGRVKIYLQDPTDYQKLGAAITYLRRYSYASICGVSTGDNDDDGNSLSSTSAGSSRINDAQYREIKALLQGTPEGYEAELCEYYKIATMQDLPWKFFKEIVDVLKG